jgi:ComF family protein
MALWDHASNGARLVVRVVSALGAALLAPAGCAACDAPVPERAVFCPVCARAVVRVAPRGAPAIAFAAYGGALAAAIRRFKFAGRPDLARPLGHLLRRAARDAAASADRVVPVPLHARRLAERGYNQAALLARHAADELGVPLDARALVRLRDTPQQANLVREARLANVARAFRARPPAALRGGRVLLVDDVATTGATLEACRDALLEAGAAEVTALVVARTERP